MLPGNTANAPEGSIAADPVGNPNNIVGGAFSVKEKKKLTKFRNNN